MGFARVFAICLILWMILTILLSVGAMVGIWT